MNVTLHPSFELILASKTVNTFNIFLVKRSNVHQFSHLLLITL